MQEKSIKGEDEPNRMSHWRFGSWVLVVLATVVIILLFTTTCLVVTVNMIWNDVNELKTELAELKQECGDGLTKVSGLIDSVQIYLVSLSLSLSLSLSVLAPFFSC